MPNVISLAAARHRDTLGVLRHLLERAEAGDIRGLFFVVDSLTGAKDAAGSTGSYGADPGRLAAVLARQCVSLCTRADEIEAAPDAFGSRA